MCFIFTPTSSPTLLASPVHTSFKLHSSLFLQPPLKPPYPFNMDTEGTGGSSPRQRLVNYLCICLFYVVSALKVFRHEHATVVNNIHMNTYEYMVHVGTNISAKLLIFNQLISSNMSL